MEFESILKFVTFHSDPNGIIDAGICRLSDDNLLCFDAETENDNTESNIAHDLHTKHYTIQELIELGRKTNKIEIAKKL